MQSAELGLELVILFLQLVDPLLKEFELFLHLSYEFPVLLFPAPRPLILLPHPTGGESLQVGAIVPVRTDESVWRLLAWKRHSTGSPVSAAPS